jgi:UPF0176 protein
MPVSAADMASPSYQPGISCPHCADKHSPPQRERFAQRQKQMWLAHTRGEHHIGAAAQQTMQQNREVKQRKKQQRQLQNARHR